MEKRASNFFSGPLELWIACFVLVENRVPLIRLGVSGVAFFKLMMNSFNKTEAALFPMQPIHAENFFLRLFFYCGSKKSYCGGLNSALFEHLILCKSNPELM